MFSGFQQRYKAKIQKKLEDAVVAYFTAHPEVKLIVVTGSVGKTSTKTAVATMLAQKYRVRLHEGNHNTHMSVPLAILGVPYPENIRSFSAWRQALKVARARILAPTDVDVIVQELGADHPGDIDHFGTYLKPDIAVILNLDDETERKKRIGERGELENPDTFESKGDDFQSRVKDAYVAIASERDLPIVSASQPIDAVTQDIWSIIKPFAKK